MLGGGLEIGYVSYFLRKITWNRGEGMGKTSLGTSGAIPWIRTRGSNSNRTRNISAYPEVLESTL